MMESKLLTVVLKTFNKQPEQFNGRNFALEVNETLGVNFEPDTIKRRMRYLKQAGKLNYKYVKISSFSGVYKKIEI